MASEASYREGSSQTPALKAFEKSHGKPGIPPEKVDPLLAEWGIYHIHISTHKEKPNDKHFARTGPLMFAIVTETDAHFVDIHRHGSAAWTRQEMLKIVDANWPHLLDRFRGNNVVNASFSPTDLELKDLRDANVNTSLRIGTATVAAMGGGLATDGTPAINVMRLNTTMHMVKKMEAWAAKNATELKGKIATLSSLPETDLDFELVCLDEPNGGNRIHFSYQSYALTASP
jgi:hypothetical protein